MVFLTIFTNKDGETVYFEEPIRKVNYIKIISCSLYNSWCNLEKTGSVLKVGRLSLNNPKPSQIKKDVKPGHYNVKALADTLSSLFNELETEINTPEGQMIIRKKGSDDITVERRLFSLFNLNPNDVSPTLGEKTVIEKIKYESGYFIHCDLIDINKNFLNRKRSDLLAKFDVKGEPYEKVYYSSTEDSMKECSTNRYVISITLRVRDKNGNLFDFKGMPLEFEVSID